MRLPQFSGNITEYCLLDWLSNALFAREFAPWLGVSTYHVVSIAHCFPGSWWGFFRIVAGSVFYVFYSFNQLSHQRNMRIVFRFLRFLDREGEGQGKGSGRGIDSRKACWWWHRLRLPLSLSLPASYWLIPMTLDRLSHYLFVSHPIPFPIVLSFVFSECVCMCVLILARVASFLAWLST